MKNLLKVFALALVGLLCFPGYSWAAIGTPVQLGTANGTTTAVITTGADAPVGSLIIVVVAVGTTGVAATSVVDSALNCTTYTALDNPVVASRPTSALFYCPNTGSDLPNGGTITVTVPSTDKVAATAFAVAGMATSPADGHNNVVNGSSNASSGSFITRAQSYEMTVGTLALSDTSAGFNPGTVWNTIGGVSSANGSAFTAWITTCSQSVAIGFFPTWTTSRPYMSNVVSFKGAAIDAMCDAKNNAYAVLSTGTMLDSKNNAYIVMTPGAPTGGLSFHSFPP